MRAESEIVAASLALEDVGMTFGGATVLKGVSFAVAPGEIVCLLGQSGCGKTTLLRIAAGLERQTSGCVWLAGREVAGPSGFVPPELRGVGLMFQDYALFPHLTILQNAMFGLKHLAPSQARTVATAALERVGLGTYLGDYPHMLSGGEQQRAALARALAPQPSILLMDEPFSNLDQRMREEIREQTIGLLTEQDTTAVVVTHDPIEAMQIADRVVLMRAGRIVQIDTPERLYNRPNSLFAARFFCDFNELDGTAHAGQVSCQLGRFEAPDVPDGAVIVCLRPEAIALGAAEGGAVGTVHSCRFLGETYRLSVSVEGLDQALVVSRPVAQGAIAPGEAVALSFGYQRVLAFAKADC